MRGVISYMTRAAKHLWTGWIYVVFGSSPILLGREYGIGTAIRTGAASSPTILGGLLGGIGAISVIRSFIIPGTPIAAVAFKGLTLVTVSALVFGFLVRGAGLAVAFPLFVIIRGYVRPRFRWHPTLLLAAGRA